MSKQLNCQFISVKEQVKGFDLILNDQPQHTIDNMLWSNNGYFPQVKFSIAYTTDSILLKYFVKERNAVARHTEVNDLVFKDSCVEFFLSFANGEDYYNLEFNCIGTPYGGYGRGKADRSALPVNVVQQIEIFTKKNNIDADGNTSWEISLNIPFKVFIYHNVTLLKGKACKANFYKCGDETPMPHYFSWNNILSDEPSFHQSEFFGTLNFV